MKNIFTFSALFLIGFLGAQHKIFVYELSFKLKKDSLQTATALLDVENLTSIFRTEQQREVDSINYKTGAGRSLSSGFENKFTVTKDMATDTTIKIIDNLRDHYALPIEEKLHWTILSDTKKIGEITCQKAKVGYGGRNWEACFAPEIPVQDGPYVFRGLPGLIIEIMDSDLDYHFSLKEIRNTAEHIPTIAKPFKINWKQFKKLATEYYNDPFKNMKPNSAGLSAKIRYVDDKGNVLEPNFQQWTVDAQKAIRAHNNPIELNHKIDYK